MPVDTSVIESWNPQHIGHSGLPKWIYDPTYSCVDLSSKAFYGNISQQFHVFQITGDLNLPLLFDLPARRFSEPTAFDEAFRPYIAHFVQQLRTSRHQGERLEQNIPSKPNIETIFASKVYQIPGVESVYYRVASDGTSHLWTVVDQDAFDLREQVYEIESGMYSLFPKARLDFYLITLPRLAGKPLDEIIPNDFALVPNRGAHAAKL